VTFATVAKTGEMAIAMAKWQLEPKISIAICIIYVLTREHIPWISVDQSPSVFLRKFEAVLLAAQRGMHINCYIH